ncbi:MAG: hypothetical protein ACQEVA_17670 [Myxococcota bacterium]
MSEEQQEIAGATEDTPSVSAGLTRLLEVVWAKVQARDEVARWFSQWVPLLDSLQSLGMTITSVVMGVKARVDERDAPYLDDEEIEQLKIQLTEIFESSPDAAELIFGLENIDVAIQDIIEDDQSRTAVGEIFNGLERRLDGVIQRLISWGIGEEEPDVTPEQLRVFLGKVEAVLQEAIDRWLMPYIIDSELKRGDK